MRNEINGDKVGYGFMYLKRVVKRMQVKRVELAWKKMQPVQVSPSYLPRVLVRIFKGQIRDSIFRVRHKVMNQKLILEKVQSFCSRVSFLLQNHSNNAISIRYFFKKWSAMNGKNRQVDLFFKKITNLTKNNFRCSFERIYKSSVSRTIENLKLDHQIKLTKFTQFSKRFLSINSITHVCKKWENFAVQRSMLKWKQKPQESPKVYWLIHSLNSILRRRFKLFSPKISSPVLLYTLKEKAEKLVRESFYMLKLQALSTLAYSFHNRAEAANSETSSLIHELKTYKNESNELRYENEKIQKEIQELIKDKENLNLILKDKEEECAGLADSVRTHLNELEIYESKTLNERDGLIKENNELKEEIKSKYEENKYLRDEFESYEEKFKQYEDDRQVSMLQNAQLKGSLKKLQDMYSQLQAEKAKIQSNDIEQRKQIISLTSTIDNLGEDKQNLYQKLSQSNDEISSLRDQLNQYAQRNEHLTSNLQFYMKQEKELQKQLKEAEDEINVKSNMLYQKDNEIQKLTENSQSSRSQMNQLKKEIENLQQNPEKGKIKQLIKENSQLNARIEELQKQGDKKVNKEIAELRAEANEFKELATQAAHDNSLLQQELEIVTNDLGHIQQERDQLLQAIKEKQTFHHQKSESQVQSLRDYCSNLEQKVQSLQNALNKAKKAETETNSLRERNEDLEDKVQKLQAELEEVNEVAVTSRREIALVTTEIENYANIFGIMEEKIAENEDKLKRAEQERDHAISEIKAVRQRYINIIAEAR